MLLMRVSIIIILLTVITACKTSEESNKMNGGYSWWSGPFMASSQAPNSDLYVTGINRKGSKGEQWVAEVSVSGDQVEVLDRVALNTLFKHDEHNAPSILQVDSNIIIAATGHANDTVAGANKVLVYTGKDIRTLVSTELSAPDLVTYVQLQHTPNATYLYSRMANIGYHYIVSTDYGKSWSDWAPLLQSGYVKVAHNSELAHFFVGSNPASNYNIIYHVNAVLTQGNTLAITSDSLKLTEIDSESVLRNTDIQPFFEPISELSSRILDAQYFTSPLSLIATHAKRPRNGEEAWSLLIAVSNSLYSENGVYEIKTNLKGVLGDRDDPLNAGYYVLGASLIEEINGVVSLVHIEKEAGKYNLILTEFDLASSSTLSEQLIYSSHAQIYRPVVLNNSGQKFVMFNEAIYWNNYLEWKATQKIITLN